MTTAGPMPNEPADLAALVALAQREHRAGRLAESAAAYRAVLAQRPEFAEAYSYLGNVLVELGQFDDAAAQYLRALALEPGLFKTHNNLGNILRRQGKIDRAAAHYQRALALRPDYAEAHNNLGNALKEQGQLEQAAAEYERALTLKPDLAQAHNNLGNILREQGKLDRAAACFRQAVALRPDYAEAYYNLGNTLEQQGALEEAATQYLQAVALKPNYAEAHNNLGNVLREQGRLGQAAARYRHVVALRPDHAEAHYNLGNALEQQGALDEAATQYFQALALKPNYAEAHNNLGNTLRRQGKFDQAVPHYEQAIALKPDLAEAHNNLGNALKEQGKFDQAAARYDQALSLKPDYAESHYDRADLKTFRAGDADLAALEALAADEGRLPSGKKLYIHFALGKALEDIGDYPRAFQHLLQGNGLKRREVKYEEAAQQQDFQRIAQTFDSALLDRFTAVGDRSPIPIFVLGMPRSGSTLVEQILASHPQVHAAGELPNLNRVVRAISDAAGRPVPFPQSVQALDADGLRQLGHAYLASLPTLRDSKTRLIDKMPDNFLNVGLIRLILPNARIIHTVRDPVDTCVSCFSKLFTDGQPFSYDLAELGCYYRGYHELMAHWRAVLPLDALLDVSYEELVDDLEPQARRLIDYCGLPWDDRCLSFHETSRPIATASNVQVRRPLYRSSVARWRRYEAYLRPLLAELECCRRPADNA